MRKPDGGEPVVFGLVPLQPRGQVGVEVVPDNDDRSVELDVCPHQAVAVVLPGETLTGALEQEVRAGPVDETALLAGLIAAPRGNRGPAAGPAAHADDGGVPAPAPGAGTGRRHQEA